MGIEFECCALERDNQVENIHRSMMRQDQKEAIPLPSHMKK